MVNVLIALALSPFIVHTLGDASYGVWILIGSLTGYLGVLDLGVRTSIVKYISEFLAKKDDESLNEVFNTGMAVFLAIALVTITVAFVLQLLFPIFFEAQTFNLLDIRWAIMLVGVDIAIGFPLGLYGGFLSGMQRYDISNMIDIIIAVGRAIATYVLLKSGGGIVALAAISLIAGIISAIWRVVIVHRSCPQLKIDLGQAKRSALKKISTYGAFSFLVIVSSKIIFYTDSVVITTFMGAASVTYFAIAANLIEYVRRFVKSMTTVFVPAMSGLQATAQIEKLNSMMINGAKYTLLLTLLIGLALVAFGHDFLALWMGPEYAKTSGIVLVILIIPQILSLANYNCGSVLYGIAKHRALAIATIVEAAANLGLSIALIKKYGLIGVALGTAIPQAINYIVWLPAYTCQVLGTSYGEYFRKAFVPPLRAAAPLALSIVAIKSFFTIDSWIAFAAAILTCSLVFAVSCWMMFVKKDLRRLSESNGGSIFGLFRLQIER